jgi:hypothetical protein
MILFIVVFMALLLLDGARVDAQATTYYTVDGSSAYTWSK